VKLSCPSCGAKYSIADEKVSDRLAKIRCRKCSATIIVDGKVNPPNVYTSSEAAPAPAQEEADAGGASVGAGEYSVDFGDNDQRTLTIDDIVQSFRRGELNQDTYVWAEGFADWQPISAVPELADAIKSVAAPAAAAASPPRAAARTGAGRGSATDLFGGIETAGSEEDVMTSAPQPLAAPAPAFAATGARNESSVLFSLSALTASAPIAPSAARVTASSAISNDASGGDDSGLIDLKALTSAAAAQAPASPLVLGTAPLGMAAPLGGMTAPAIPSDRPSARQGGSKTGLYIGGALLVVGTLIAGAIVVSGNREPPVALQATPAAQPAPVAPAPVDEPKKEEPTAAPPSTGTAVAEAPKDSPAAPAAGTPGAPAAGKPVAPAKVATGGSHAAPKPKSAPAAAEKPAEKPAAKPEPAADAPAAKPKPKKEKTCNCSPGDLMCAMKCAAS
jgi:predicted Zn finger-like uncharacterized protein